jgi:hypothetical protein
MIGVRALHESPESRNERAALGPAAGLASPVWHRQGPAARYGRCRRRFVVGA